ncbi:MAG: dihydroorotate dehydrogenase (quinone) [Patescibacteria group bacterium]|jgi:dihydroorotate dehydrogenase subfamily 2
MSYIDYLMGYIYRNIIKRFLFLFPADSVHELFLRVGKKLGQSGFSKNLLRKIWRYDNIILEQTICGLDFKNPIGLSAGFDYNADLVDILPSLGFGFNTVGTVTHESYQGNPAPMLGRLPKSKSLLVNKGFKNAGISTVLSHMSAHTHEAMRGVSIGATNKVYPNFAGMIENILVGFYEAEKFRQFDYYELNISCPNLLNLQNLKDQLSSPTGLKQVLECLETLHLDRPVFIKMPTEKTETEIINLMAVANKFSFIKGLIFSNLVKDRSNPAFDPEEIKRAGQGNFSGKPVEEASNNLLRLAYKKYHERFILIGVGGVFTAEDAYKKILYGASLVQLITGMVYMGPQQIGVINRGLTKLLKQGGYKSVSEAIGVKA